MSVISDYVVDQKAFNGKVATAIDNIKADIEEINKKIISAEDVAALAELKTDSQALVDKAEALDNMNPPTPPVNV